jgi:ADP-dependent phosphofructokinase/glucokinase
MKQLCSFITIIVLVLLSTAPASAKEEKYCFTIESGNKELVFVAEQISREKNEVEVTYRLNNPDPENYLLGAIQVKNDAVLIIGSDDLRTRLLGDKQVRKTVESLARETTDKIRHSEKK